MKIEGVIIKECGIREGQSENGSWKLAEYVLQTEERFPHRMCFKVMDGRDGRIARLDLHVGKRVAVNFDIDAREYNGSWFNTITAWDARPLE
jgi:hypothetical protein